MKLYLDYQLFIEIDMKFYSLDFETKTEGMFYQWSNNPISGDALQL